MIQKIFEICVLLICVLCGCSSLDQPKSTIVEVKCSECEGKGSVIYGPHHPIVELGFEAGTYDCPMCGGSGTLYEDLEDNKVTYDGRGQRPSSMPPKRPDGREFDGGPDFGNGSWAQRDEDNVWRRCGG